MQSEVDTRTRLIQFFMERPLLLKQIMLEPSHVEVWEEIFFFFFGSYPHDDGSKQVPVYWRPGSTDPRWDTLLFKNKLGAMQALDTLILEWRKGKPFYTHHKEAA
jgi:hypothetical protein